MRATALVLALLASSITAMAAPHPVRPAARLVSQSATGGTGTRTDPWTGWEVAFASIPKSGAEIRFPKGFYSKTLALELPTNLDGVLHIVGEPGSQITLTDSTPGRRLFDIGKLADYDVFRNVVIEGIRLDANQVSNRQAVLIGATRDGVTASRLSFQNITIRRCYLFNATTDPNVERNHSGFIRLNPTTVGGESQLVFAKDILVDAVKMYGGNWGVLITGGPAPGGFIDRVTIRNSIHDMRQGTDRFQPTFFPSTCFHVGQEANVGSVVIEKDSCFAPGDNCFEVNNAQRAELHFLSCSNPFATGFTVRNFVSLENPQDQVCRVADSAVLYDADPPFGRGVRARGITSDSGNLDFGALDVSNFRFETLGKRALNPQYAISAGNSSSGFRALTVTGLSVHLNWAKDGSSDITLSDICFAGSAHDWDADGVPDLPIVRIRDLRSDHSFDESKEGTSDRVLWVTGSAELDVDGLRSKTSSRARDRYELIRIGDGRAKTVAGRIRHATVFGRRSSEGTFLALYVAATSEVTIAPTLDVDTVSGLASLSDAIDPSNRQAVRDVMSR